MIGFILIIIYLVLFILQIKYLITSVKSKAKKEWVKLFLTEVISLIIAATLCYYFNITPGDDPFSYMLETIICAISIWIFVIMIILSIVIRIAINFKNQKKKP